MKVFVANPVKPEFHVPFQINNPYTNQPMVDYDIVLNFDRFDLIIRIFRWLQTIAFTLLLAVGTRKLIKW